MVRCLDFPGRKPIYGDRPFWKVSVHVDVTVFVKPHTLQFGQFSVETRSLDVEIAKGLHFETYHMVLFSTEGSIVCSETGLDFTAHNFVIRSLHGSITGNWSFPSSMSLRTGDWSSVNRPIDIDLIPKRWSSGPWTAGTLSAQSESGDISIRMPLDKQHQSLRNMSIDIRSASGSITGSFFTGIQTALLTGGNGSVNATLQPDFSLPDTSSIITTTDSGDTNIRVLPPVIDPYYKINPLNNTKSDHTTGRGNMRLRYPVEWEGTAVGWSASGNVSVGGDAFDSVLHGDRLVVARRGKGIQSRLDFATGSGSGIFIVV